MHVHTIFTLQFDDELGEAQARSVRGPGPLRFAWPPCFFVSAGFRPRLAPSWIGRAPAAKIVTLRGWRGRT